MKAIGIWAVALLLGALLAAPAQAASEEDVFAFIPLGGKSLLIQVAQSRPPAAELRALLTGKHTRPEWLAHLKARQAALPALKRLGDHELLTLADYLAFNMPLPAAKLPADLSKANWGKVLPMDGRDIALNYCQSCHIITVVITQDRTQEAWLGTMHKPSHIEIDLTEPQREALASYLVLNAAIPIDDVPEPLRAGGATY